MLFDPIKSKMNAFSEEMLKFHLGTQFDPARPMGNVASFDLEYVIKAWLVGLHAEVAPIIPRSLDWIGIAQQRGERFGVDQNAYRTTLHWAKAMGIWMESGRNVNEEWKITRDYEEARWSYEERPWSAREIINSGLDDYMAFAYLSGELHGGFEAGIEVYERWMGKPERLLLSKLKKPRDFAYALCLQSVGRQSFEENDLFRAGRKLLQANLQETWFGSGQYIRGTMWLKIVYGYSGENLTPLQTVLRAYDNMPKVNRPEFISPL